MTRQTVMGPVEWGLLLVLSLLWGGSFFFSKIAVQDLPPLVVVLVRVLLAAIALAAYLRLTGHGLPRQPALWRSFFIMGLLNNLIPFSLLFWGQTVIASSLAAILNATTPVFSILLAHMLTKDEKMTALKCAGVVLGILGVAVLMGGDTLSGGGRVLLAMLACLGAALSYGLASVFGRRFRRLGVAPAIGAFGQVTATTVMMVPVVVLFAPPWHLAMPGPATIAALCGLALLSTALAYVVFFHLLATAGATNSSLVTLLIPVSAILLGSLFLGEHLDANHFAGMALIAGGLLVIDGRAWNWARRQRGASRGSERS